MGAIDNLFGTHLPSPLGESMPRKGYKRAFGRSAGMPQVMTAQNFNRRITAEEALILATAGDGSKTEGFRNLLSLYGELHNIGFRSRMSLQEFLDIHTRMSCTKIN